MTDGNNNNLTLFLECKNNDQRLGFVHSMMVRLADTAESAVKFPSPYVHEKLNELIADVHAVSLILDSQTQAASHE